MRYLLITLFFISNFCFSQSKSDKNKNIQLKVIRYTSAYIGGFAEGTQDALNFHYSSFKRVHPNIRDQFWDPSVSWTNKWTNHDPNLSERFVGSSTFLVWTTDGWHRMKALNRLGTVGASIIIPIGEKKKWYWYLKEIGIGYVINRAGFYTSYNLIYK